MSATALARCAAAYLSSTTPSLRSSFCLDSASVQYPCVGALSGLQPAASVMPPPNLDAQQRATCAVDPSPLGKPSFLLGSGLLRQAQHC